MANVVARMNASAWLRVGRYALTALALVCCAQTPRCDEVTEELESAIEEHIDELRRIEDETLSHLDAQIEKAADEGDLDRVMKLRFEKQKMVADRAWPTLSVSMQRKIKLDQARADRKLREAYKDAIAELTKKRQYDSALGLKQELEKLTSLQESIRAKMERASDRGRANEAIADEAIDYDPSVDQPPPVVLKQKGKGLADQGVDGTLALAFSEACKSSGAADPLLKHSEQIDKMRDALHAVLVSIPPSEWTFMQVQAAAKFFLELPRVMPMADYATMNYEPLGNGRLRSTSMSACRGDSLSLHWLFVPWLQSSADAAQFTQRAIFIDQTMRCLEIRQRFGVDYLKDWLKAIGCTTPGDTAACLAEMKRQGVSLPSVEELLMQLPPPPARPQKAGVRARP